MINFKVYFCNILFATCVLTVIAVEVDKIDNNVIKRSDNNDVKFLNPRLSETKQTSLDINLQKFDLRYSTLPEICGNYTTPKGCTEATACTNRSGIYMIENYNSDPYYVECDHDTMDGDWLVIQRRQDGSVDFYRDWIEYEQGFGNIDGEFWIGLKKLYALTNFNGPQELLIIMDDYNLTTAYAKYDNFSIGDANAFYNLKQLGKYSGTAGDALTDTHLGMKFSTRDRDNDLYSGNCAVGNSGAWWYRSCHESNLNGKYGFNYGNNGPCWFRFRGFKSLKYVKMMIRRRKI